MNLEFRIKNKGFTLIELLVVISIIGILAALSLASFTTAQKQARDTQRKSDLKQYQSSLEMYANKNNGLYPSRTTGSGESVSTLCTDLGLLNCPEDPKNLQDSNFAYKYQSNGTGGGATIATSYVLWSSLENVTSTYWVVCSTGQLGKITSSTVFSAGGCPAGLTQ